MAQTNSPVTHDSPRLGRRGFLGAVAAGTVTLASARAQALGVSNAGPPSDASVHPTLRGVHPDVAKLFSLVRPGVGVVDGWRVDDVRLEAGAVRVELRRGMGERATIDFCLRAERPVGVEQTRFLDAVAMNTGAGHTATPPDAHRAVRVLAAVIRREEAELGHEPAGLLSHAERQTLFERGVVHFPPRS